MQKEILNQPALQALWISKVQESVRWLVIAICKPSPAKDTCLVELEAIRWVWSKPESVVFLNPIESDWSNEVRCMMEAFGECNWSQVYFLLHCQNFWTISRLGMLLMSTDNQTNLLTRYKSWETRDLSLEACFTHNTLPQRLLVVPRKEMRGEMCIE